MRNFTKYEKQQYCCGKFKLSKSKQKFYYCNEIFYSWIYFEQNFSALFVNSSSTKKNVCSKLLYWHYNIGITLIRWCEVSIRDILFSKKQMDLFRRKQQSVSAACLICVLHKSIVELEISHVLILTLHNTSTKASYVTLREFMKNSAEINLTSIWQ